MIDPGSIAFDVDGVVADTMRLFSDIASAHYNIADINQDAITCYNLNDCLDIEPEIVEEIYYRLFDGNYDCVLHPYEDAGAVLSKIAANYGPVLFVTARPYVGPVESWLTDTLGLPRGSFDLIATGSFKGKLDVLLDHGKTWFVEDRLETCIFLKESNISPVLFKRPWNRANNGIVEVETWKDLSRLLRFDI